MINYAQVDDEINKLFYEAWKANTTAIVGYVPDVYWQNVQRRDVPDGSKFWIRVSRQTIFEEQTTLSTCEEKPGQRRYTANGLVFVQLFLPKSNAQSFQLGQQLAVVARDAFRGKATENHIWFRNSRINELNPEERYFRINVVTEFEYDELG